MGLPLSPRREIRKMDCHEEAIYMSHARHCSADEDRQENDERVGARAEL